jgi:hypothetical protein
MSYRDETMQVVSVLDPAIDIRRMGYELLNKYLLTRDIALITPFFRPGEKPTIYHLREVPQHLWETFVRDGSSEPEMHKRAFMCALVKVENLFQRDGTFLDQAHLPRPGHEVMATEALARFRPQYREEIGAVAFQHSFFDPRTLDCFLLPPSLVGRLEANMRRTVESNPSSPAAVPSEAA